MGLSYLNLAEVLAGPLNRPEEAARFAMDGAQRAREVGLQRGCGVSLHAIAAEALFRLGRWEEADEILGAALERNPTGGAAIGLYLARGRLSVGRGRFEAAAADLRTAEDLARHALDPRYHAPLCTLTAALALWEGRIGEARTAIAAGLERLAGTDDRWYLGPLVWHGMRAEGDRADRGRAGRMPSEVDAAREAAKELLAPLASQTEGGAAGARTSEELVQAYALLCAGEASRIEGTSEPRAWGAAAVAWETLGQAYPAAYARARQAEALLGEGAEAEAAPLLQGAHRVAMALGANPFRREIELLAARSRMDLSEPRPTPSAAPEPSAADKFHLTAREREVLQLIADGSTNRQIAGRLFISEKTASVHVSNILAKLSVNRRGEAAAVAHRLGLLLRS